jgi:hypothetical protein
MRTAILIGGAVIGGAMLYTLAKRRPGESLASTAGREIVGAAGNAASGAVIGVGSFVGIPATNLTQCQKDIAAGRTWDASFSCPATTFIGSIFSGATINAADVNDARQIDRIMEREQAARGDLGIVYDPRNDTQAQYDQMGNRIY